MAGGRMQLVARATRRPKRAPRVRKFTTVYRRAGAPRTYPVVSPRVMTVKLRYSIPYSITLQSVSGNVGENLFRANSVYDPDATGVGLQPRGFDQYMSMYDHFCVLGSKITARFHYQTSAEGSNSGLVSIVLNDNNTHIETYTGIQESRYRKIMPMNAAQGSKTLVLKYSTRRFFGRGKVPTGNLLNDKELSGSAAANPDEQAIFHCNFHTINNSNATVYLTGWIDYIVAFHEPKQPPIS